MHVHVYPYRITHRVRKLLMLIPTDPQISETLECIANKVRLNKPTDYSKCIPICISVSCLVHLISYSCTSCEAVELSYIVHMFDMFLLCTVDELTKRKQPHVLNM